MTREATDADRWLLARLRIEGAPLLISEEVPTQEQWHWRYGPPPRDPCGPEALGGDDAPDNEVVMYVSSLHDLEMLGWVWRGVRAMDMRKGWGLTFSGERERARLRRAGGEMDRWRENAAWWRDLTEYLIEAGKRS